MTTLFYLALILLHTPHLIPTFQYTRHSVISEPLPMKLPSKYFSSCEVKNKICSFPLIKAPGYDLVTANVV